MVATGGESDLGYMYVLGLEQPMNYITHSAPYEKGKLWLGSAFKAVPGEKQYGTFTAINLNTGKRAWQVKTDQPMIGGALATAGNLVFTGEGNGHFNAYDARTGKVLWSFTAGAGCNAPPVTLYRSTGSSTLPLLAAATISSAILLGDAVMVFALPGGAPDHEESEIVATRRMEQCALSGVVLRRKWWEVIVRWWCWERWDS